MEKLKDCPFCSGGGRVIKDGLTLRADGYIGGFPGKSRLLQIPCPACNGAGKIRISEGTVKCAFCSGTGGSGKPCSACGGKGWQVPKEI